MITVPTTVGGRPVIRCMLGLFGIASCFFLFMPESKDGLRPRLRSGLRGAIYKQ